MSGREASPRSLTDVAGITVGHATADAARTGCTVVLGPFRAAVDVRGSATGTRELAVLEPGHLAGTMDAILLTGGSAFGLAAADGVVRWLDRSGRGFDAGVATVPIVAAAVLFDLHVGDASVRPDAAMGERACESASGDPVAEGAVGAGAGATVGKMVPDATPSDGGVGSWSATAAGYRVGVLVVANPVGDVRDGSGAIVAGARRADGSFADVSARLQQSPGTPGEAGGPGDAAGRDPRPGRNTTLAVVATDAPLDRVALQALARAGSTGVARRVTPYATPFDGDVTFAVSTAPNPKPADPATLLSLYACVADASAEAVTRAVTRR